MGQRAGFAVQCYALMKPSTYKVCILLNGQVRPVGLAMKHCQEHMAQCRLWMKPIQALM